VPIDIVEGAPDEAQWLPAPPPTQLVDNEPMAVKGAPDQDRMQPQNEKPGSPVKQPMRTALTLAIAFFLGAGIACAIAIPVMIANEDSSDDKDNAVHDAPVMLIALSGTNVCAGKKPASGFENINCTKDGVIQAFAQAGADVTAGYRGDLATNATPINSTYLEAGVCPVNVHWHLGAEHRSAGEFDEGGRGPVGGHEDGNRRLGGDKVRLGLRCYHYDSSDSKFTTPYDWKHCVDMTVGETYEVHWPHSAAGACGTPNQYQTPFYDGVFCKDNVLVDTAAQIGVQSQVFTVVNDEDYYYPDLMRGMIVDGDYGANITKYTGSTTGTSRNNEVCSQYTPITWQVDRKCHLISASTFDKMCADMKAQRDDMSKDLHAHGSRELVDDSLTADNHQRL